MKVNSMPDFSAAITLLKKPFDDLYENSRDAIKTRLGTMRAHGKIKNLHKRLYETQKVKTIWNIDRPLSLSSFFYPVKIIRRDHDLKITIQLNSLNDLPNNHNIIFGTVGQGKSILIKYLLGKEIKSGTRVPVLCELRNVTNQTLESYLINRFSLLLGEENDAEIFEYFANNGKLTLLFDGFDEIDPSNVEKLMQEIEDISYKYNDCRILVTSRPDSECKYLSNFHANDVATLSSADLEPFYKKITRDPDFTQRLVAALKTSPTQIRELVNTPLLATLLAISYRTAQKIPLDFAEFYDGLFQTLLVRHDGSKLGWRRHRRTKLNDREIQRVFEAFCFATRKKQSTSIDKETVYQIASEALENSELKADSQSFIEDIIKITCLLMDDGKKVTFVHASVQEFFASRFIKTRTDPIAARFYSQLLNEKWMDWQQEILFLQQIDTHRVRKNFITPDMQKTLQNIFQTDDIEFTESQVDQQTISRYLNNLFVVKTFFKRNDTNQAKFHVDKHRDVKTFHYSSLNSRTFYALFSPNPHHKSWSSGFDANPESIQRTYEQIAKDRGDEFFKEFTKIVTGSIKNLISDYNKMNQQIQNEETPTDFISI